MRIHRARLFVYGLPFSGPVQTARGRFTERQGILLALEDQDGRQGWGDAAPWPGFGTTTHEQALGALKGWVREATWAGIELANTDAIDRFVKGQSLPKEAVAAVELGLLDLLGQERGCRVAELLGEPVSPIPICKVVRDSDQARAARDQGFCGFKVKLGTKPWEEDLAGLEAIRAVIGKSAKLRADVNGAWSASQAERALGALRPLELEWLEQPVAAAEVKALEGLRGLGTPIAADEGLVYCAQHGMALPAVDLLVLKPGLLGGLLASQRIAEEVRGRVATSYAWESGIGRAGALHLASLYHGSAAGLASPLARDLCPDFVGGPGLLALPEAKGLGAEPDVGSAWEATA